jgi:outer membrane biosynthesis protein TonB
MPTMKPQARMHGVVEIVIDEQGRVAAIAIRESIQPIYDAQLLSKGRDWRYEPATLYGVPVKYRKVIQLNVTQ